MDEVPTPEHLAKITLHAVKTIVCTFFLEKDDRRMLTERAVRRILKKIPGGIVDIYDVVGETRDVVREELKKRNVIPIQAFTSLDTQAFAVLCNAVNAPQRRPVTKEQETRITRAMNALPMDCKIVYVRRKRDGHAYEKIATELGISVGDVIEHMTTALYALAQARAAIQTDTR